MKLWLKFVIGLILGIAAAFIIPFTAHHEILDFMMHFVVRFGRYCVVPLVLFSGTYGIFRLAEKKELLKTTFFTIGIIVAASLFLTVLGMLSIAIIKLPRIPISLEKIAKVSTIDIKSMILQILPFSAFTSANEGTYLLPVYFLAICIGLGCNYDKFASKAVITLFESAYQLTYNIMVFFVEMFSIGMIALTCYWIISYRDILMSGIYNPLILMFSVDFILVGAVIYPLILRYGFKEHHPYKVLYASVASLLAGFITGDTNLVLPINMRSSKESLGVHDDVNGFLHPLYSIFSRGGSSLVVIISFVVIWRSYSSLSIPVSTIFWASLVSLGLSFLLGTHSAGGTFIVLSVLCTLYGRRFESAYLLLEPAAGILCSFAAAFDVLTAIFGTYATALRMSAAEYRNMKNFI